MKGYFPHMDVHLHFGLTLCFAPAVLVENLRLTISSQVTIFLVFAPISQTFQQTNGTCGLKMFPVTNVVRFTDKCKQFLQND